MFCSKCSLPLAEGAEFCSKCGTAVAAAPQSDVYCDNCGYKIGPHNTKCLHCGAPRPGVEAAPYVPPPARSLLNVSQIALAAAVVVGLVWFIAFRNTGGPSQATDRPDTSQRAPAASETVRVTYRVFGSGTDFASVTYTNAQGGTEQQNGENINSAWETTFSAEPGEFVYLSAQNSSDSGSVTCEIRVDGGAFKHSVSTGGYGIASCSGALP